MHLLYLRSADKSGSAESRAGYASLDSLREVSGLPAWRLWEIIDELQELELVSCIWNSRALKTPSVQGAQGETSSDLRFLRSTEAGLTAEGRAYPPLLEYNRERQHRRWDSPHLKTGRIPHRQSLPRRPHYTGHTERNPERMRQPSRGYQIYRPKEQAARRLLYLACGLSLVILLALVLALT